MNSGDEEVGRLVVEQLGRPLLLKHALAHDDDPVAHRHRLDLVVRDEDRRHPELLLEARDLGAHLDAQLRVEVGERLVHEEDLRLPDEGPPHRDPLALAAGEVARPTLEMLGEAEELGGRRHALADLGLRHLLALERVGDVVEDAHVRVERVVLEDHRDVALLGREVVDDPLADPQLAVGHLLEPRHHPQRGRLAAARRADEDDELPVLDLEVEIDDGARAVRIGLADVREGDGRHGAPRS